jgi:hypothetical protein
MNISQPQITLTIRVIDLALRVFGFTLKLIAFTLKLGRLKNKAFRFNFNVDLVYFTHW